MPYIKAEQKLVSFSDTPKDLEKISDDMSNGWSIISLMRNSNYYVGIMELNSGANTSEDSLFIPPRKRIKISS